MKRILIASACLVLVGCHGAPQVKTQTVSMPVAVTCAPEAVPEPTWALDRLPQTASYGEKIRAALGDLAQARGYIFELQAQLNACR